MIDFNKNIPIIWTVMSIHEIGQGVHMSSQKDNVSFFLTTTKMARRLETADIQPARWAGKLVNLSFEKKSDKLNCVSVAEGGIFLTNRDLVTRPEDSTKTTATEIKAEDISNPVMLWHTEKNSTTYTFRVAGNVYNVVTFTQGEQLTIREAAEIPFADLDKNIDFFGWSVEEIQTLQPLDKI